MLKNNNEIIYSNIKYNNIKLFNINIIVAILYILLNFSNFYNYFINLLTN